VTAASPADVGAREVGEQRVAKLCIKHLRTGAEVGLRGWDKRPRDPGLVLIDGGVERSDGAFEAALLRDGEFAFVRLNHAGDDRFEARVLRGVGRSMRDRHTRRHKGCARLLQKARHLFETIDRAFEALRQRRELARHQAIERPARETLVAERIPRPCLPGFGLPDACAQRIAEDGVVDLVGAAELGFVDRFELMKRLVRETQPGSAASGADIIDLAIEAVIACAGCAHGRETHRPIEPTAAKRFECAVGAAWGLRKSVRAQQRDEHG
jgi:hypothetical protein